MSISVLLGTSEHIKPQLFDVWQHVAHSGNDEEKPTIAVLLFEVCLEYSVDP